MSWIKHTGCTYHTQDTYYYCGAAAAMMILAEIGIPYAALDQDDLYLSNHNHNSNASGWYTDADGLAWTLNDRKPAGHLPFLAYRELSEATGTRKIVHTLHVYGVSPAVLVFGCMHWIVVPGVQTDVEPLSGASYTVEGLWIHNPVYYSSDPPPPHDASDGCGSGGLLGEANEFVTYEDWQDTYYTGCTAHDPGGTRKWLSVCDPEVPELELPMRREPHYLADGQRLIAPEQAIEFSEVGLKDYALWEDEHVAAALQDARPGEPRVVTRLDRRNSYYHLVPWETKEGVTALTRVDSRFGTFRSMALQRPTGKRFLHREAILDRLAYRRIELPEPQGRITFYPEVVAESPTLVWRPCQESYSPCLPFYQYTIGEQVLYVRVDGQVFTDLTTTGLRGD